MYIYEQMLMQVLNINIFVTVRSGWNSIPFFCYNCEYIKKCNIYQIQLAVPKPVILSETKLIDN